MIYSDRTPITFQDELPAAVDVVVIGGGVIGISTAWFLARAGVSVLVCDKGRVAGEQSSRNWGWIRQQSRDPDELPIVMDSINIWESLSRELDTDIGFTREGTLSLAETEADLAAREAWLETAREHQLDTKMLTSSEVDNLVKDKPGQWQGGMFTASDGRAEPFKAVPALAAALQKHGGLIRESCAVRSLHIEAGKVTGVITEDGHVRAQSVVCAGGVWSTLFLRNLGISLPQLAVRATVLRTADAPDIYAGNATIGEVSIRRRQDGGYTVAASTTNDHFIGADSFRHFLKFMPAYKASTRFVDLRLGGNLAERLLPTRRWRDDEVSPFEKTRVLNPAPSQEAITQMRRGLRRRLPQLADIAFDEAWAGMMDVTPDVVPVMDQVADYPGLFLATGFSGHGFGIGPGAGRVMADMIMGRPPVHDLTRFRLSRFSDGSRMKPGPGL